MEIDFDNDPLGKYIIQLQDVGLQINEYKNELKLDTVPIDWYMDLLEHTIKLAEDYRKYDDCFKMLYK